MCSTDRALIKFPRPTYILHFLPRSWIKINLQKSTLHNPLINCEDLHFLIGIGSRSYAWFMKHFPSDPLPNFCAIRPVKIERWVVRVSRHDLPPSCQIFHVKRNDERRRKILFHFGNKIPGGKGVSWAWSPIRGMTSWWDHFAVFNNQWILLNRQVAIAILLNPNFICKFIIPSNYIRLISIIEKKIKYWNMDTYLNIKILI